MAFTAFGVLVDLVNQLRHGMHAIAQHLRRVASCGCDQFVTHHEQTKIIARHIAFNQNAIAKFDSDSIGRAQLGFAHNIDSHAFALVAVQRFHHHGPANLERGFQGIVSITDCATHGHRDTRCAKQFFGELFVLPDGLGNGAGGVNLCGLNAPLFAAPTKAHHRAFGHAAKRNIARYSGIHDRACTGPKANVFVKLA